MIDLKNITIKTFKGRILINDLSLVVNPKDKIAIIGEEGNGKSSLLKAIYDLNLVNEYAQIEGSINKGKNIIGYLPQFVPEKYYEYDPIEFLLLRDEEIDYSLYEDIYEVVKLLESQHLNCDVIESETKIKNLSGGEKVKLQLIKLQMLRPDLLLLDEPTNDLDLRTLKWLENFINSSEIPIVFISHDETLLENCANKIVHIEQLKKKMSAKHTIEVSNYKDYYNRRIASIEKQHQEAMYERRRHKKQMEKLQQVFQRVEHEQNVISRSDPHGARLLAKKMKSVKSMEKRFENQEMTEIPEVEEALTLFFDEVSIPNSKRIIELSLDELKIGDRVLSQGIELEIYGPQKVTIIGENGVGKSTFLRLLRKQLEKEFHVGYIPQNYQEMMDFSLDAISYLTKDLDEDNPVLVARNYLGNAKFTRDEMQKPLSDLSGGQLAKLFLIKQIINKVEVLLLDEPTRNLSPLSNPVFRNMIRNFKGCVIAISHDRKFINEISDQIYTLTSTGLEKSCNNFD